MVAAWRIPILVQHMDSDAYRMDSNQLTRLRTFQSELLLHILSNECLVLRNPKSAINFSPIILAVRSGVIVGLSSTILRGKSGPGRVHKTSATEIKNRRVTALGDFNDMFIPLDACVELF